MNSSRNSLEELLLLRSQWENIVIRYKIPNNQGTIDNLIWFVEHGHSSNRFRKRCNEAMDIARTIIEEYNNGSGKEITTGIEVGAPRS